MKANIYIFSMLLFVFSREVRGTRSAQLVIKAEGNCCDQQQILLHTSVREVPVFICIHFLTYSLFLGIFIVFSPNDFSLLLEGKRREHCLHYNGARGCWILL